MARRSAVRAAAVVSAGIGHPVDVLAHGMCQRAPYRFDPDGAVSASSPHVPPRR